MDYKYILHHCFPPLTSLTLPHTQCLLECRDAVCTQHALRPQDLELSMGMSGDFEQAVGSLDTRSLLYNISPSYLYVATSQVIIVLYLLCSYYGIFQHLNSKFYFPGFIFSSREFGYFKILIKYCIIIF